MQMNVSVQDKLIRKVGVEKEKVVEK